MLGEGFDHPKLSVAAIFRPFRTLAPYIQFVGRIMRVVVQNDPTHPDNLGHIITHLGMNLDQRVKEFKQFENDDQTFWERVVGGADPEVPTAVREGSTRLTASENDIVVNGEIVDSLWEEDFADMDEKHIVDDLKERLKLYGIDPDKAEEFIKASKRSGMTRHAPTEAFPVQPHKEWDESKRRVGEQGTRLAKILLNNVGLEMTGTELAYKYTSLKARAKNNLVSAIMLVNHEINGRLGNKERSKCTTEEFKAILEPKTLEDILQILVRRVHKAKNEYEKNA
jgi:hypothetical protein